MLPGGPAGVNASDDRHCRADDEEVKPISVRPNNSSTNFIVARLSYDSIDRRVSLQVHFGPADSPLEIYGYVRRSSSEPAEGEIDVVGGFRSIGNLIRHSLTL